MDTFFVGGYATEPRPPFDREASAAFYAGVQAIPGLAGLEVPILGGGVMHENEAFLLDTLFGAAGEASQPRIVITCIPATMGALGKNPSFGLASANDAGREEALAVARQALDTVGRIHARTGGRKAVVAVEIHSAPKRSTDTSSSADAFAASLKEIGSWDWQGAVVVVEHCDYGVPPSASAAKGFLSIEDEIAAIRAANTHFGEDRIGVCVNWARSVLERRDVSDPVRHIRAAGSLLKGIMFSGCSGQPAIADYGAWQDTHMPLDTDAEGSLMTAEAVRECIAAAKPHSSTVLYVGGKITLSPVSADPAARAKVNANLLKVISDAVKSEWREKAERRPGGGL